MGRPKGYDRDQVLEKAMQLFWRKGYEGTHLQELVEATGLNRFSLYKEFSGKDGLYDAAVSHYLQSIQHLGEILSREPLGLENILEEIRLVVFGEFPYGCFMINSLTQQEVLDQKIRNRVRSFVGDLEGLISKNLEAAKRKGEIAEDWNIEGLAKFIVTFDIGVVTYSTLRPSVEDKRRIYENFRALVTRGTAQSGSEAAFSKPQVS